MKLETLGAPERLLVLRVSTLEGNQRSQNGNWAGGGGRRSGGEESSSVHSRALRLSQSQPAALDVLRPKSWFMDSITDVPD